MPVLDEYTSVDSNIPVQYPDGKDRSKDQKFDLGEPAETVYEVLAGANRQQVIDMGRRMAEITIPSVMPPQNYRTGDWLPGTNQSVGAMAVNNLASKIMFMAFPPGQPMMRLVPVEQRLQKQIDADPDLYARIQLALSRVEEAHRERAATTSIATAWVGFVKLLLIGGNALWKQVKLECPTFHMLDQWACSRDMGGHPILTIHQEKVRLSTLDEDIQMQILDEQKELAKVEEWSREAIIYSVCRFCKSDSSDKHSDGSWEYWEETEKGSLIEGSEVETDYNDCPMWPAWCIPVYGQNYGRAYCEEYRGDLYILESNASALNDGAAQASLALTFVKPGGRTSLRQVQKAKNLSFLSGSAEDLTTFRTEKSADFNFVMSNFDKASQRIAQAFSITSASMRQGERVTAEEVQRTGQALDQAMGGLYTELAQSHQRRMIMRFVRLHEEEDHDLPALPPDLVRTEVITGVDAMGRSADVQALEDFGADLNKTFPPNAATTNILDPLDYATRSAAARGIKPDGLVRKQQDIDAANQAKQQQAAQQELMSKAAGPMAGPMAKAMADRMPPPGAQPQGPQPGAPAPPQPQQGS